MANAPRTRRLTARKLEWIWLGCLSLLTLVFIGNMMWAPAPANLWIAGSLIVIVMGGSLLAAHKSNQLHSVEQAVRVIQTETLRHNYLSALYRMGLHVREVHRDDNLTAFIVNGNPEERISVGLQNGQLVLNTLGDEAKAVLAAAKREVEPEQPRPRAEV